MNDNANPLNPGEREQVDQFLSLISFRYIPNRVLPIDIIKNEHLALRDVLIRRLAKKAKSQGSVFDDIGETSAALIKSLKTAVHEACPDIGSIRLATPLSWQDLIFAFGYRLKVNNTEIDDIAQGSGIQSLLMFETLSLIDRDYFQKFGWRQAAIWAVEEPESSLHTSLEVKVAAYLSKIASDSKSRLQIMCTTHSDIVLQYSDKTYFVEMNDGKSGCELCATRDILEKSAKKGVSRWTHPILQYPLEPVFLVEGKCDHIFVEQALKLLIPSLNVRVTYLEILQGSDVKGGVDEILKYIKNNIAAIRTRGIDAPVIVLLDWDSSRRVHEFQKILDSKIPCKVEVWPETACNPKLGPSFHGIERYFSDRIIDDANNGCNVVAVRRDGIKVVPRDDYDRFKVKAFEIVNQGLKLEDLGFVGDFLRELVSRSGFNRQSGSPNL